PAGVGTCAGGESGRRELVDSVGGIAPVQYARVGPDEHTAGTVAAVVVHTHRDLLHLPVGDLTHAQLAVAQVVHPHTVGSDGDFSPHGRIVSALVLLRMRNRHSRAG